MAMFEPFRAIGHIVDDVPIAVQRRGRETYATVSVGTAWQVYNTAKLTVVLIGPQLPRTITALACHRDLTLAALENGDVVECRRVHVSGVYRGHSARVVGMLVLGDTLLTLSVDGTLRVWALGQHAAPVAVMALGPGFTPTALAHPDTYLNKVVVGSTEGRLQLWNFSTGTMLHEFPGLGAGVKAIAPSPALDVVGLGLADGRVVLLDLLHGETVAEFSNASGAGAAASGLLGHGEAAAAAAAPGGAACTALAFRTGPGLPLLAAGGAGGVVTLWDLERRRLHAVVRDAHDAGVTCLHFFAGEPRLLSAGRDNAAKQWALDGADGAPRLLRFRAGHAAPPCLVRHCGAGRALLSAGGDRTFRVFSTVADQQSRELSQRHVAQRAKRARVAAQELRLPRVAALASADLRERDWASVVTAHLGDPRAYTWRLAHATLGEHVLEPPGPRYATAGAPGSVPAHQGAVTAVALSACGNFALVGSAGGHLHRYNMQSGAHRGEYRRDSGAAPAHAGPVTALASDGANRWLASAGADGVLRTWDFKRCGLKGGLEVGARVERGAVHAASGLLALAADDLVLRVYDIEAQRLVRRFEGHQDRITDLQFSEDCRWLLTSSMDGTLRIWDVPGAQILQVLQLGEVVTSLSFSPAQDLLATTSVSSRGINLWSNQLIYGAGADVVPSAAPLRVHAPRLALDAREEGGGGAGARAARLAPMLAHTRGGKGGEEGESSGSDGEGDVGLWSLESPQSSSDSEEEEGATAFPQAPAAPQLTLEGEVKCAVWSARTAGGAPAPLVPSMITLSLLPRSQWQSLAHLETVKARNAPAEAPRKPEAAPFFLPSLAGARAGRDPVFASPGEEEGGDAGGSAAAARLEQAAAAAWGGGSDDEDDSGASDADGLDVDAAPAQRGAGAPDPSSRVRRQTAPATAGGGGALGALLASPGPHRHDAVLGLLRGLTPIQVDAEVRALVALGSFEDEEAADPPPALAALLACIEAQVAAGTSFDFVQALLRLVLEVHRHAFLASPQLQARGAALAAALRAAWERLDAELNATRCVLGLLGNLQP